MTTLPAAQYGKTRGTPFGRSTGQAVEKACHCEPVRRLAWQSVPKSHNFYAFLRICN